MVSRTCIRGQPAVLLLCRPRQSPLQSCHARRCASSTADPVDSNFLEQCGVATRSIHADHTVNPLMQDIAPPIHVSTTFRQLPLSPLVYSRNATPTRSRVEAVLSAVCGGEAVTYSSGQAALLGLLHQVQPRRVLVDAGYHGTHHALSLLQRWSGLGLDVVQCGADGLPAAQAVDQFDLVYLETPNNPYMEVKDPRCYGSLLRAGGVLAVDATLASPLGLDPFKFGADFVFHSCTKVIGGHSDVLAGVLVTRDKQRADDLLKQRTVLGGTLGSLESSLLLRSLRTLSLRVTRQAQTALSLAEWMEKQPQVRRVWHSLLPSHDTYQVARRTLELGPCCFSFSLDSREDAEMLCRHLVLISKATSFGGVESLIDHRVLYDASVDPRLLRLSVGLEEPQDLMRDLKQALLRIRNHVL
eukprot:g34071.t1